MSDDDDTRARADEPSNPERTPSEEAALQLELIAGEPDPRVALRVIPENGEGRASTWHGTLSASWDRLEKAQLNKCGVFFTVSETDGSGVKASNIRKARASFIDLDGSPLPAEWPVEPHLVIETSPGRFHAYWMIEPETDLRAWSRLQSALAQKFDADPSVKDAPRVMRLAGFKHLKREPFTSRIVSAVDAGDVNLAFGKRFVLNDLATAMGVCIGEQSKAKATASRSDRPAAVRRAVKYLEDRAPVAVEGENGDQTTFKVAANLHDMGISEPRAFELMLKHYNGRCEPSWEADALKQKVQNAYKYATTQPGSIDLPFYSERDGKTANTLRNTMTAIGEAELDLAFDEVAQRPVIRAGKVPWKANLGRELNDDTLREIRHWIVEQIDFEPSKENVIEAALTLAQQNQFNPIADYLGGLKWDGVSRLDTWLTRYMGAPDGAYERAVGRLMLTAAVRRTRHPGVKFDTMVILEGRQGSGKSSALRVLAGEWFTDAELGQVENKDAAMLLNGAWIVEIGELTAMSRSAVSQLKAFLSRSEDRYRAPYDRLVKTWPRRSIFVGTTNHTGYFRDQTGNRRFLPVATGDIDLEALKADRDQLWAEAEFNEYFGDSIVLPSSLWAEAGVRQEERLVEDPWADTLRTYLAHLPVDRISSNDLLTNGLGLPAGRQAQNDSKRLREVMQRLGHDYKQAVRIDDRTTAGYVLNRR